MCKPCDACNSVTIPEWAPMTSPRPPDIRNCWSRNTSTSSRNSIYRPLPTPPALIVYKPARPTCHMADSGCQVTLFPFVFLPLFFSGCGSSGVCLARP